jgi:hypothetical protein
MKETSEFNQKGLARIIMYSLDEFCKGFSRCCECPFNRRCLNSVQRINGILRDYDTEESGDRDDD